MSSSAVLAATAWGLFVAWLAYELRRDIAVWRKTQKRGRERRVPPRPAQTQDEREERARLSSGVAFMEAMASTLEEIRGLPETSEFDPWGLV